MRNQLEMTNQETGNEHPNAMDIFRIESRLARMEEQLERVEAKLDTHQDYIQELWMSQPPAPHMSGCMIRTI